MSLDPMPTAEQLLRMKAEREARGRTPMVVSVKGRHLDAAPTSEVVSRLVAPDPRAPIEWPVRLTLPWSLLVSDNERKEPYVAYSSDGPVARMRLTKRYAEAKEKIEQLARGKLAGAAAAEIPLELWARVWIPGGHIRSDVANFGKAVHDALEKVVYRNDNLLHATHWVRAGVDVDSPRAELTITPLVS